MLDALRPHELLECLVIPRLRQVVCEIDRRCLRAGVGEGQARDRHLEAEIDPHPFHEMALLFDRLRDQHSLFEPLIGDPFTRSEEHTSELQSLMRTSYAVFWLKKKTNQV